MLWAITLFIIYTEWPNLPSAGVTNSPHLPEKGSQGRGLSMIKTWAESASTEWPCTITDECVHTHPYATQASIGRRAGVRVFPGFIAGRVELARQEPDWDK